VASGFQGDKVILASGMDSFSTSCLTNREFHVGSFNLTPVPFVTQGRFIPLLRYLKEFGEQYRYVIWVDAADQIFQSNPSDWLDKLPDEEHVIIAARECWRIKDELQFNDPWLKASVTTPDYERLREQEVLCGGTVAGTPVAMYSLMKSILESAQNNPRANDQSMLAYYLHRYTPAVSVRIPSMRDGWTATCTAFDTQNFHSPIGKPADQLTDDVPIFDTEKKLVLTPDGVTPFVLVHQYNRDARWIEIMRTKFREW
jgi:hypothetical protein